MDLYSFVQRSNNDNFSAQAGHFISTKPYMYSDVPGNLYEILFFPQMPGDGRICEDIHSISHELLARYHDHTAWP